MGITMYGCGQEEADLFREMAPRLGILATVTDGAASVGNAGLARGNRCISIDHKTHIAHRTLQALSQTGVEYISTRSVGYNHLDLQFAQDVGITVENVAYSPDSVADFTLMLILMVVRNASSTMSRARAHDYRLSQVRGKELRDMTIGVIGTGRIGVAVIERLQGFGCRVLAHDPCPRTSAAYVPLDELLQQSDVVTLHAPLNANTHHLLDGQRIELMKYGAFIVNTARGALIDGAALVSAVASGRLGGAALDVLEGEEGVFYRDHGQDFVDNQLLLRLEELPNVIITPHTAYYTDHALRDTVEGTLLNCLNFERRSS